MNIAVAGNTSLAYYCLEKLCRAGYSVRTILLPRKGFIESSDTVDFSSLTGEFDLKRIQLPSANDFKDDTQTDLLVKLEWPENLSIPIKPVMATIGCNLSGQYRQGKLLDVAADIYEGRSHTELQLFSESPWRGTGHQPKGAVDKIAREVLAYSQVEINIFDDVRSLKTKASVVFSRLLFDLLDNVGENGAMPDPLKRGYVLSVTDANRVIDWQKNVTEIYNLVRSYTHPGPGAFTRFDERKLTVWRGHFFDFSDIVYNNAPPGTVLDVIEELGVVIKAGAGSFLITRIQPAGAPVLPARVWADESHIKPGDMLKTYIDATEDVLA